MMFTIIATSVDSSALKNDLRFCLNVLTSRMDSVQKKVANLQYLHMVIPKWCGFISDIWFLIYDLQRSTSNYRNMNKRFSVQQRTEFPCRASRPQACHPSVLASQSLIIHLFLFSITVVPLHSFPTNRWTFLRNSASEQGKHRKTLPMMLPLMAQTQISLTLMMLPWVVPDKLRFHLFIPLYSSQSEVKYFSTTSFLHEVDRKRKFLLDYGCNCDTGV